MFEFQKSLECVLVDVLDGILVEVKMPEMCQASKSTAFQTSDQIVVQKQRPYVLATFEGPWGDVPYSIEAKITKRKESNQ